MDLERAHHVHLGPIPGAAFCLLKHPQGHDKTFPGACAHRQGFIMDRGDRVAICVPKIAQWLVLPLGSISRGQMCRNPDQTFAKCILPQTTGGNSAHTLPHGWSMLTR